MTARRVLLDGLAREADIFGREWEVKQIFGRLQNKEFKSSSVVGERRIGKTSLLNYLADPGIRAVQGVGPEHCSFVYVDLQMVDATMGPEQLWRRLLTLMRRQCLDAEIGNLVAALEGRRRIRTFDLDEFSSRSMTGAIMWCSCSMSSTG